MRTQRSLLFILALLTAGLLSAAAQNKPSTPPDPVKYIARFDVVWNLVMAILTENNFKIDSVDRGNGRIVTKPYEFITGSLSGSELAKLATPPEGYKDAVWIRGRYKVEVVSEIVQGNETMVTVRVYPQGLRRDVSGKEEWMDWQSDGTIERRLLGRLSVKLLSPTKPNDKKGFWDQPAQTIPRPNESPKLSTPQRDKP